MSVAVVFVVVIMLLLLSAAAADDAAVVADAVAVGVGVVDVGKCCAPQLNS